jgi:hypothetical protein
VEFLDSYGRAFGAFDVDAIVDHFVFPSHIVSDAADVALMPFATAHDSRAGVERVLAMHRELGVKSGRVLGLDIVKFSPRMVGLQLDYAFVDSAGTALYDFRGFYTLVNVSDRLRIAAISHNQIPRLAGCLSMRHRTQ